MKKRNQLTIRMLRGVMLLMTMLLVPIGALAEDYDLWVSGQQVTDDNLTAICSDQGASGSITFDGDHTLTFTNVPWNSFNSSYPFIQTSMDLTIHLVGISQPDMGNVLIQRMDGDNETHTLTFTTDPDNPGMFLVRGGSLSHEGFTVVYENGLAENPSGYYAEAGGNYPYAWIAQTFLGGAGTSESPYLIKSAADLKLFSDHFNEGAIDASASVQLYNDINCEEMEDFAPIGDYNNSFAGTFDGNNKVISNLTATDISGEEIGLFRYLATNGTIQNLTLDNFTLSGGSSSSNKIGAFVAVMNGGTISNCQLSNSSISCLQNTQNPTVGGIVGQLFAGSVTDCIVDGSSIKAQTLDEWASGANANAGGIVGALTGDTISGCQVKGATAVLADYADYGSAAAGAIVANNNGGTLANNTYEYTVTVTEKSTAKSGYEQRGIGGTTYNSETEADESIPDITTNNGAVMYTQKLTIVGLGDNCGIEGVGGYEPLADPENHIYYFAPGQETTFYLYPDATYEASVALTYSETSTTISKDAEEDSYKFTMPDVAATLNVTLTAKQSIWIGGIEVSEGGFPDVKGAAYDAETNTLTLTDFEFTQREGAAIEFGIEGLKVHLVGENTITCHDQSGAAFKSLVADNTITFSAEDDESRLTMATLTPYSNLTASYNGKLVYIAGGDYKYVMPIEAPYLGVSDGILMMNAELLPEGAQCFYAIDYADETLTDVDMTEATAVESFFEGPEILGPCTVTSYMKAGTAQSSTATGKYFGFATSELNVPLGTSEVDLPAIVPAMGDDVEVEYEGNVSEGKINLSNTTIGKNATQVMASFSSLLDVMPFTILNDYANLTVNVLPPAPTIVFDETKEYLNTDVVSITMPEVLAEDQNARIMYSWVEDCEDGNGSNYTDNSKVTLTAGTGTLYAWVRYNSGTSADDALYSERVSQVFTVKTDISNAYIPEFTTTATYTGSAIVPEVTVYDSEKTMNVLDAASYAFAFQQVVNDKPKDVEAMVNAGTYVVSLVGKGAYGGSIVIAEAFEVVQATPTITFAQESYSAVLGEEFSSPATVDNWDVTPWASSDEEVATVSDGVITIVGVGTTTITVFYAGDDNYLSTVSSYQLVVSRALDVAFVGTNLWASYYATENLAVPEGLTAYIVSGVNGTSGVVTVQQVDYIPADNGVLLQREANGAADGYVAAPYDGTTSTFINLLQGSASEVAVSSLASSPVYVLYNDKFKRATSGTIPARRAFLPLAVAPAGAPQLMTLSVIDGISTGISTLAADDNEGSWYTIDGLKLSGKPQHKGLYIKNGKKVFFNNK